MSDLKESQGGSCAVGTPKEHDHHDIHDSSRGNGFGEGGGDGDDESHHHYNQEGGHASARTRKSLVSLLAPAKKFGGVPMETKWVELLTVNDHARFRKWGRNTEISSNNIVNIVDTLYQRAQLTPPIRVALGAQITFVDADPYTLTKCTSPECTSPDQVSVDELLSNFLFWRLNAHTPEVLFSSFSIYLLN
jgi:hypothetical protein